MDRVFPATRICLWTYLKKNRVPPNGMRYLRVGGTRQRRFAGTNFKPRKLLENAASPTRRVHAVLGNHELARTLAIKRCKALLTNSHRDDFANDKQDVISLFVNIFIVQFYNA